MPNHQKYYFILLFSIHNININGLLKTSFVNVILNKQYIEIFIQSFIISSCHLYGLNQMQASLFTHISTITQPF